ncbi:MAG: ISNCY family transposase [Bellilinea sp.]
MSEGKEVDKLHTMSDKEIQRLDIMTQLSQKQLTQAQAAEQLSLSVRQVKRLWRTYTDHGAAGLINKSRGKPSHNQVDPEVQQRAIDLLLEHYRDFGPTLATEKLLEVHGLRISDEKVRQIMIAEGLWKTRRKRKLQVFQMRERRARFGELVQIDGSDYDWFEGRSPRCTLLVFVDDATGKLVELQFVPHESFNAYCEAAQRYFERYGKPGAFYSDKHGIFHLNNPRLTRGDGLTDFGRAMQALGIQIICANTPQAKGRVERANKTLQDRLTKELRLRGISTPEEANQWLPEYMQDFNQRFASAPRSSLDAHAPLGDQDNLDRILCRKAQRTLSKNLTIQYDRTIYQIRVNRPAYAMKNATVTILESPKGEITILYKNQSLAFEVYHQQEKQAKVVPAKSIDFELRNASYAHPPAADHPWRKGFATPLSRQAAPTKGDSLTLSE